MNADTGWYPEDWQHPADSPELDWIIAPDDDHPDPTPPEDRLAQEPESVEASERGQGHLASLLRGELPDTEDDLPPGARQFVQPGFPGLDLRNYSQNPQQKGWGAPCASSHATVALRLARVTVDARIAELVGLVMRECERRGYIFRAADTGAYNCRKIGGTNSWSNHAWALAIDVNWQTNPFTRPLRTDIPSWMHNLWNRYGFAWGGDYLPPTPCDAMHFEFMGSPQQAQIALSLARAELSGAHPVPGPSGVNSSTPFPYPHDHCFGLITDPSVRVHGGISAAEQVYVRYIQQRMQQLGYAPKTTGWADGVYENPTVAAVAAWQHARMPGTTKPGQVWWDDWAVLVNLKAHA